MSATAQGLKKTAAAKRLKELAVLGGGNSDTKDFERSDGTSCLPLVKKCNALTEKLQYFFAFMAIAYSVFSAFLA